MHPEQVGSWLSGWLNKDPLPSNLCRLHLNFLGDTENCWKFKFWSLEDWYLLTKLFIWSQETGSNITCAMSKCMALNVLLSIPVYSLLCSQGHPWTVYGWASGPWTYHIFSNPSAFAHAVSSVWNFIPLFLCLKQNNGKQASAYPYRPRSKFTSDFHQEKWSHLP